MQLDPKMRLKSGQAANLYEYEHGEAGGELGKRYQVSEYPNVIFFLLTIKHIVTNNPYLWERFLFWSTLDEKRALECLSYGSYPILRIFADSSNHGDFLPSEPAYINVNINLASELQHGWDPFSMKSFEALVLHELVHWGRDQSKTEDGYYAVDGLDLDTEKGEKVMKRLSLDSGKRFSFDVYLDPDQPQLGYRTTPYPDAPVIKLPKKKAKRKR
jgi:hypothetical protein